MDGDEVLGVQLNQIQSYTKIITELLEKNTFSKICLRKALGSGASLEASVWGDATGGIGCKDSLFCTSFGLIGGTGPLYKKDRFRNVDKRYLGFMGYFKENTHHFDKAISIMGENIFNICQHQFKIMFMDEEYTFNVKIRKLKGDAPFLQKVLGNSQGGNEGCFLCDEHKDNWKPTFFKHGNGKSVLSLCIGFIEKKHKHLPRLLLSFIEKIYDEIVQEVFGKLEVVIDSLHLVKNLFENVRETIIRRFNVLQYSYPTLSPIIQTLLTEIINNETAEVGGDISNLKKVRYYRKALSNVSKVYGDPIKKSIESVKVVAQCGTNESEQDFELLRENVMKELNLIQTVFNCLAEISFFLYKNDISNVQILQYWCNIYNMFHLLSNISGYDMKLYDHLTYNHSGDLISTKRQHENSNEQDECIFKFVRIVLHLFGGRQVFKEKNREIIGEELFKEASGTKLLVSEWSKVPKLFELVWRRLEARKSLSETFGNIVNSTRQSFKEWKQHEYLEMKIPRSIIENDCKNAKWNKFIDCIYPIISECTDLICVQSDLFFEIIPRNEVTTQTKLDNIDRLKSIAKTARIEFQFISEFIPTNQSTEDNQQHFQYGEEFILNSTPKDAISHLPGAQLDQVISFLNISVPPKTKVANKKEEIIKYCENNLEKFKQLLIGRKDIFNSSKKRKDVKNKKNSNRKKPKSSQTTNSTQNSLRSEAILNQNSISQPFNSSQNTLTNFTIQNSFQNQSWSVSSTPNHPIPQNSSFLQYLLN